MIRGIINIVWLVALPITRSKSLVAASLSLALIVFCVFAAEKPFRIRSVSTHQPGEVSVVVELPLGLTPDAADFDLIINNPVARAREISGLDLNITFLVAASRSMQGSKKDSPLQDAKSALLDFLDNKSKRPQDRFDLISFADQSTPLSSFDKKSIESLKTAGPKTKTFLYQVLHKALDDVKNRPKDDPQTRRIFIVISDGKDEGSEVKPDQVMQEAEDALVPIYIVFRGKTSPPFRAVLESLANASGGKYVFTENALKIEKALEEIYQLEKKSLVVRFVYPMDPIGTTTEDAAIKLRRPDGSALTAKFPEAVPSPLAAAPPPPILQPWLLWQIATVIFSGGAIWVWRHSRSTPVASQPSSTEEIETGSVTDIPPRHRTTTLIARHFPAPTVGQPTAMLRGVAGTVDGQLHSVEKGIFSIGAGAGNDLSIGEDEYVSSEHAYLRYEKGSLFIFDRASRNGTFVNDEKVTQTGIALRPGDRIKLGMSTFEVVLGAETGPVLLGVAAPRQAAPGSSFNARFVAYIAAAKQLAEHHLIQFGEENDRILTDISPDRDAYWRIGAPITVRLTGEHVRITPVEHTFRWNGRENLANFAVQVDADAPPPVTLQICFHVFLGPVQIAFIPVPVSVSARPTDRKSPQVDLRPPSSAFASYSSKDAEAVSRSLSTLAHWAPTLDIFQDCLDLTPNEAFKARLAAEIAARDVFLLFWSRNACASKWVLWEFETAQVKPGLNAILPMPLEDPTLAPPPPGFEDKHLRDRFMIAGYGLRKISEESSRTAGKT